MYNGGQKFVAEFMGAFTLLFFGVGSICFAQQAGASGPGLVGIALAHGLAIAVMFAAVGHISGGHFNPAVTAAFWVTRRLGTLEALLYWVAQLLGAAAGSYLITLFYLEDVWRRAALGVPALASDVSPVMGIAIEAVLTFLLVFVFFGTAANRDSAFGRLAPFAIGLTITGDILAGGVLTGAAMNPARAFGPALVGHYWANQAVYWVGPLAGGIVAGSLYSLLLIRKPSS
ncbi:MAG TPA: MIP family channel protein [Candidatus Acidoferrales bacterium]|nr:MIP family channel protein [Candidatus Acidoferrales bacterium]